MLEPRNMGNENLSAKVQKDNHETSTTNNKCIHVLLGVIPRALFIG
jgi:hypothetical protein